MCGCVYLQPAGHCSKDDVVFIEEHGGHVQVGQVHSHASMGCEMYSFSVKL